MQHEAHEPETMSPDLGGDVEDRPRRRWSVWAVLSGVGALALLLIAVAVWPRGSSTVDRSAQIVVPPPLPATGDGSFPDGTLCHPTVIKGEATYLCNDGAGPPPPAAAPVPPPAELDSTTDCVLITFSTGGAGYLCQVRQSQDLVSAGLVSREQPTTVELPPVTTNQGVDWQDWVGTITASIGTVAGAAASLIALRRERHRPLGDLEPASA